MALEVEEEKKSCLWYRVLSLMHGEEGLLLVRGEESLQFGERI